MLLTRVRVREAASQVVGISTWLKGRLVAELAGTEKELAGEPEQPIRSESFFVSTNQNQVRLTCATCCSRCLFAISATCGGNGALATNQRLVLFSQ